MIALFRFETMTVSDRIQVQVWWIQYNVNENTGSTYLTVLYLQSYSYYRTTGWCVLYTVKK